MQSYPVKMSALVALNRLFRLPLAIMVALSSLAAGLTANASMLWVNLWILFWAIFLLTASCSVLNQVQERLTDAFMSRTCQRPIACGQLDPAHGNLIGMVLGSAGLVLLFTGFGGESAALGLFATAWYLLVYTPLKRITSFAVIAGTPCGVLPVILGWHAATGSFSDPRALALGLILLLWQVPHFWLLALPDREELQIAGFQVLPDSLSNQKVLQICHSWILALASASLLLPLMGLTRLTGIQVLIVCLTFCFAVWASRLQKNVLFAEIVAKKLRLGLHLYLGTLLGSLLVDALLSRFA